MTRPVFRPLADAFGADAPPPPTSSGTAAEGSAGGGESGDVLARIFGSGGLLARALPGGGRRFEERAEQLAMARAVDAAVRHKHHLLVEAGTGTGKSYAYLAPLILWAVKNDKKVVIATHTKALQGQLVERDLPFLQDLFTRSLGVEFRYALCLGTGNYVCPRRLAKADAVGLFTSRSEVDELRAIQSFARKSLTGRSVDLSFEPSPQLWAQVNRESDLCLGRACPQYDDSFFYKARREQEKAHVLVANHHLLFAHLASGGNDGAGVLPAFDALVIDEAHQAEDVAGAYLGHEVVNLGVARLIELLHSRRNERSILQGSALPDAVELDKRLCAATAAARAAAALFFEQLVAALNIDTTRAATVRMRVARLVENSLDEPLQQIETALKAARKSAEAMADDALSRELEGYGTRCQTLRETLDELLQQRRSDSVYWTAVTPRPGVARHAPRAPRIALCSAPIDVSVEMQQALFGPIVPVIMASATMTTGGNFDFLRERLGLVPEKCAAPVDTLAVGSPFDFENNALLYVARDLPDPSQAAIYEQAAIARAAEVVQRTQGRAFVLCTSFRTVDAAATALRAALPENIRVLKQGEGARGRLLDEFRRDVHSVLVGTTSFWQGVDVPGEALTCVVIMKLPFAVPDEPLVQARVEALRAKGRDAFNQYQVPQAVMMFRQGFGRLIRTRQDWGIVAVLDPRLMSKGYGATFLRSLPPCTRTTELAAIEAFVARHEAGTGGAQVGGTPTTASPAPATTAAAT